MPSEYFDRSCNPISEAYWTELMTSDNVYRIVARNTWYDGDQRRTLSTVWLGLAHGHGPAGPLIFATRIYNHQDYNETEMYLHATETQAMEQHHNILGMYQHPDPLPTSRFFKVTKETFDDSTD